MSEYDIEAARDPHSRAQRVSRMLEVRQQAAVSNWLLTDFAAARAGSRRRRVRELVALVGTVLPAYLPEGLDPTDIADEVIDDAALVARTWTQLDASRLSDPFKLLSRQVAQRKLAWLRSFFDGGENAPAVLSADRHPRVGAPLDPDGVRNVIRSVVRHPHHWAGAADAAFDGPLSVTVPATPEAVREMLDGDGPFKGQPSAHVIHVVPRGANRHDLILEAVISVPDAGVQVRMVSALGMTRAAKQLRKAAERHLEGNNLSECVSLSEVRTHSTAGTTLVADRQRVAVRPWLDGQQPVSVDAVVAMLGDGKCRHDNARWVDHFTVGSRAVSHRLECHDCHSPRLKVAVSHQLPRAVERIGGDWSGEYVEWMELRDQLRGVTSSTRRSVADLVRRDGTLNPARRNYDPDGDDRSPVAPEPTIGHALRRR